MNKHILTHYHQLNNAQKKISRKLAFVLHDYTTHFIQCGCPTKIVDETKIYVGQYIISERRKKKIRIDEGSKN